MNKTIRLLDVAKRAGVGVGTASRVINNHPSVKEDKRQRVLKAIDELGYQCNYIARSLKASETRTIGIVIPDIANEFYADIVLGVESVANSQSYTLLLSSTGNIPEKERLSVLTMREKMVDGVLVLTHTVTRELLDCIENNSLPAVFAATTLEHPVVASVNIHNQQAACDAVESLIRLGHTRIAMVAGPQTDQSGGVNRLAGYRQALSQNNICPRDEYLLVGEFSYQSGYRSMERLIQLRERPTAVFLASDYMAIGAIKAACDMGLRVPHDVSVMGFDNLSVSEFYHPSISTVNQPRYEMGKVAMQMLLSIICGKPPKHNHIVLNHQVIMRQSSTEFAHIL